ncbi:MAG: hypothetical protein KIS92_13895 [Planctomycetota bacterium]|nr:hypothetical protein [Planctomycetota bacterium]
MSATQASMQSKVEISADELEAVCARLEEITERLGALYIGGAHNHRMANLRHLLLGEAFRVRVIVRGLRGAGAPPTAQEFEDSILAGLLRD